MDKIIIQVTSGHGPAECCRVVAKVQELMLRQARETGIHIEILHNKAGDIKGTLQSTTLLAQGPSLGDFTATWKGTLQWIAASPYRKLCKRRNWFIGISIFPVQKTFHWDEKEVLYKTCRASGPGGQHVNKVETAVRGTHKPSGIQVLAMDSRSQQQNKKRCRERLKQKVAAWQMAELLQQQATQWQEHNILERGNAAKTITAPLI